MEVDAGFDVSELEQLAKDLETVADCYPVEAAEFMRSQGAEARTRLRQFYAMTTTKRSGNLVGGIRLGRVHTFEGSYQVRVKNVAPHAHLIEHGHIQWKPMPGKSRKYQEKTEQFVEGRHPAAFTVQSMKATIVDDAAKLVDEVLRKGGFL